MPHRNFTSNVNSLYTRTLIYSFFFLLSNYLHIIRCQFCLGIRHCWKSRGHSYSLCSCPQGRRWAVAGLMSKRSWFIFKRWHLFRDVQGKQDFLHHPSLSRLPRYCGLNLTAKEVLSSIWRIQKLPTHQDTKKTRRKKVRRKEERKENKEKREKKRLLFFTSV